MVAGHPFRISLATSSCSRFNSCNCLGGARSDQPNHRSSLSTRIGRDRGKGATWQYRICIFQRCRHGDSSHSLRALSASSDPLNFIPRCPFICDSSYDELNQWSSTSLETLRPKPMGHWHLPAVSDKVYVTCYFPLCLQHDSLTFRVPVMCL